MTGRPCPAALVREAAVEASWRRVHPAPGCAYEYRSRAEGVKPLSPGQSCLVTLEVRITGRKRVTVDTRVKIRVLNVRLPAAVVGRLLYSNEPEIIKGAGLLYQAAVEPEQASRLFYHHQNRSGRPLRLLVHLTNPGAQPVECALLAAVGGPHPDPILAGHRAASRFLGRFKDSAGQVVRIPPHSARVVTDLETASMATVSGILELRPLGGGPLVCQVRAETRLVLEWANAALLTRARGATEIYAPAQQRVAARYHVGGHWVFLDLGRTPVARKDGRRHLQGNYGVLYTADLELVNPHGQENVVILALAPRGGWARGAFVLGNQVVETGPGHPPQECRIGAIRLRPRETRRVVVSTVPAGGSSYPAWLVARSEGQAFREEPPTQTAPPGAPAGGKAAPASDRSVP